MTGLQSCLNEIEFLIRESPNQVQDPFILIRLIFHAQSRFLIKRCKKSSFIENTGRRFHYKVQWSEVNYFISALKIDFLRRTLIVCSRLANMIFSPR